MANDANEIVIAPGGTIRVADVGTAEPADSQAAPGAGWVDVGYASEDGVTFRVGLEKEDINVWQSQFAVRQVVTARTGQIEFALRQWNLDTIPIAFGGGTVTNEGGGEFSYVPPGPDDAIDERAIMVDWTDGDKDYRLIIRKATLADEVETQLVRSAAADLPVTFDVLGEDGVDAWTLLTNDPAFS